jgi:hypothetical protein
MGEQPTTTASYRPRWPAILAACVLAAGVLVWRFFASPSAVIWLLRADAVLAQSATRSAARWLLSSDRCKSEVLAQPTPSNGELKHIEWDGWGFAGQDNTVFLVYDPTDALAAAATSGASGKYPGIPCEVVWVHRLESHWYTSLFYTNTYWDSCEY